LKNSHGYEEIPVRILTQSWHFKPNVLSSMATNSWSCSVSSVEKL
jgi:hypothetical protein